MLRRAITILLVMAFILVFSKQLTLAKMMESKKPRSKSERVEKIKARVELMTQQLKLNELQRKRITEILTQNKEEIIRLLEETGSKIAELKERAEEQIDTVLTEQQKKIYRNMTKEEDEEDEYLKVYKSNY